MNIENMTTEEAVKKYIKPFVIQKYLKSNIDKQRLSELSKYAKLSGFSAVNSSDTLGEVHEQIANDVLHTAMKELNLSIVIKRPPFPEDAYAEGVPYWWRRLNGYSSKKGQIIKITESVTTEIVQEKTLFGFGKTKNVTVTHKTPQYLCEVEPEDYVGKVPLELIEATGKAVEAGLLPRVWIAGTESEICNSVRQQVDPLVVGYPIIKKDEDGNKTWRTTHCLLIGAWGKDLELIDSYFSSN